MAIYSQLSPTKENNVKLVIYSQLSLAKRQNGKMAIKSFFLFNSSVYIGIQSKKETQRIQLLSFQKTNK